MATTCALDETGLVMDSFSSPKRIVRLEQAVVNRIAAGEVIQRPSNAIKEMMENSLDAGATVIQIVVKNGGLKMLQIQDNGSGIAKDDLPIVCERFTTSKLKSFEDLSSISTYGFRGEALASISHVAHVTITSRTKNDKCAFRASFSDGKLISQQTGASPEPKPCAGNQGTQIHVEDLFYNMPTRRNALKNPSDEYHKIIDVVSKYAVHNTGVAFSLKKFGDSVVDVRTSSDSTDIENIGAVFGQSIAKYECIIERVSEPDEFAIEILSVSCEDAKLGLKMNGYVTNANYSVKKFLFLLFINHRLVDSTSLRKAIDTVYSAYLPKNTHPFVYMSLEIAPMNIDVNVHPTKHEVHFLHEALIVEAIQRCIEDKLLGCNESRTYYTQTHLPGASLIPVSLEDNSSPKINDGKVYAHQMIRTDSKEQTLDSFIVPKELSVCSESKENTEKDTKDRKRKSTNIPQLSTMKKRKHHKPVHLTSVNNLIQAVKDQQHQELCSLFREHKFVGCVDQTRALVQYQTNLYLINLSKVSQDLFYQLVLLDFANFKPLQLNPPASLYQLAMVALDSPDSGWTSESGSKESLAKFVVDFFKKKSEMLEDYFSMKIDGEGSLVSLPMLLESFIPNLDRLPMFILRLVTEVDWEEEQECFKQLATEISLFYCLQYDRFLVDCEEQHDATPESSLTKVLPWRWIVEHVLFPSFRVDLVPSKALADNGSILQIADLRELYKVFERC